MIDEEAWVYTHEGLSLHALQKYWVSCLTFLLVQTRQGLVGLSFFSRGGGEGGGSVHIE